MYTQPVQVEIGDRHTHVAGGGTYRHVSFHFPNGLQAHVACVMTADGRAESRVGARDEDVTVFAYETKCERPPEGD